MITTLTADTSNTIQAEGSVVICQSERGRHVRVIRWAQRGACGLTRVNILYDSLPASFSNSLFGCVVKGIQWCHCLPFCQALSFLCEVKNTNTSSKAHSQNNVQFI